MKLKMDLKENLFWFLPNKYFLLWLLIHFIFSSSKAQTYLMYQGGVITTCSGTIYDPGGNNNYNDDLNISTTICSSTGGPFTLTFTQFSTETNWDVLRIFNGTTVLAYSGNSIPPPVTSMGNCITLVFKSDYSNTSSGFVATISCGTVNSCQTYNQNNPFNPTISGSTSISCGNSTTLTCSETDSRWYAQPSGGSSLSSNNTLTVSPTSNTTYYVQREKIMLQTKSFSYTGVQQSWTVPNGVTSINAILYGAKGADATYSNPGDGGKGGKVQANLPVTPGETLYFFVGNTPTCPNCAGWNGGGNGSSGNSGGGGGASDIRTNGTNLSNRILVAAGGGGGGCYCFSTYGTDGGDGGGLVGGSGVDNNNLGNGGGGGSQNSGGIAGCSGASGSLGQGGTGTNGGGGGGGGYYGGGAGCYDQGGGGGSSYAVANATNVIHSFGNNSGFGFITINYNELCVSNRVAVNVTVNSIPAPSNPTSNSPQCYTVTITRSGTPPTGTTWYWQGTNANGTSTSLGSGTTYSASSSGTYYIRALNSSGCWSSSSGSINVLITGNPLSPANPISNSPQCSSVTITRVGTPPSNVSWFWQGSSSNGFSTALGSGLSFTANSSGTYYIRAKNNNTGCWSDQSGSVNVIVSSPLPPPNPTSNSPQCSSAIINRSGSPASGEIWYWQDTNSNGTSTSFGSGPSYSVNSSGTYYIRALNSNGCWSNASGSTIIDITGYPTSPTFLTSNSPNCDSVTVSRSSAPPTGINWFWQGTNNSGTSTSLGSGPNFIALTSGTYYLRAKNYANCWSLNSAEIPITVLNASSAIQNLSSCDSFLAPDGQIHNLTGQYLATLVNSLGCDSLITLNLTINPSYSIYDNVFACQEFTWIDGNTYTQNNNTATFMLTSDDGCDSLVNLNLHIGQPSLDTTIIQSTAIGVYTLNGVSYTESGIYYQTLQDIFDCDSIISIELLFETDNLSENLIDEIKVSPNPSINGIYALKSDGPFEIIKITDCGGKVLPFKFEMGVIDINELSKGIYFLWIKQNESIYQLKLLLE